MRKFLTFASRSAGRMLVSTADCAARARISCVRSRRLAPFASMSRRPPRLARWWPRMPRSPPEVGVEVMQRRRQCSGRSHRHGVRARRRLSRSGQHRRRRLHGGAACADGTDRRTRLPREGAPRRHARHVSRQRRQSSPTAPSPAISLPGCPVRRHGSLGGAPPLRHETLELSSSHRPSRFARDGFVGRSPSWPGSVRARGRRACAAFQGSAALLLPNGQPLAEGAHAGAIPTSRPTLQRIADNGSAGFYEGAYRGPHRRKR
jgi:hypothetical protein